MVTNDRGESFFWQSNVSYLGTTCYIEIANLENLEYSDAGESPVFIFRRAPQSGIENMNEKDL